MDYADGKSLPLTDTLSQVAIWLKGYKHKQRKMREDQRLKKNTSTRIRSGLGSLRFAWLWNTSMIGKFFTEISKRKIFSWHRTTIPNWETLVLQEFWVQLLKWPQPWLEHPTTWVQKSFRVILMGSRQTFGVLACSCMKCAPSSHLSMARICTC